MTALGVIGCTFAGAGIGGVIGFRIGEREDAGYGVTPIVDSAVGVLLGGIVGCVIGTVIFA